MEQGWPGLAQYIPSTPADWNPRPRTVQDALDQLASGGAAVAAANMFVWQPGGTTGKNIYATLAALEAALQDIPGPKIVGVDTTHGAATVDTTGMPAGGWRFNDTTWMPCLSTTIGLVTFAVGAKLDPSVQNLTLRNMEWISNATATVWTPTGGIANMRLDLGILVCSAAGAFLDCAAGGTVVIIGENGSAIGDGTHTVINVENTGTLDLALLTGSELQNNAIAQGTAGGGAADISSDGSCSIGRTQGAGPVYGYVVEDPQPTFVLDPNATNPKNQNVFTSWADLGPVLAQVTGKRTVRIKAGAGVHITAGTWDIDNVSFESTTAGTATASLFVDEGVTLTTTAFHLYNVAMRCAATTASPIVVGNGASLIVRTTGQTSIRSGAGAKPLIEAQSGATVFYTACEASSISNGGNPVLQSDAGATFTLLMLDESALSASTLTGLGAITLGWTAAAASAVSLSQVGLTTLTLAYLEAPNFVQAANNTGSGTTTTSAATGNIARKRSGKVAVQGLATGIISANGTVTVSLLRDATPILTLPAITVLLTTGFSIPIFFVDTMPDNANHTYSVQALADGAHTITVGAGGNLIQAAEY